MSTDTRTSLADSLRLSLLVPALTVALILLAAGRTLTPDDVGWLSGAARPSALLAAVAEVWGGFVGALENPARLLSLTSTLVVTVTVGIVAARSGPRSAFLTLLALAAMPLFWLDGTGIATSMPVTAAVAALSAVAAAAFRRGPSFAGRTALLLALGAPFALSPLSRDADGLLSLPAENGAVLAGLVVAWLVAVGFLVLRFAPQRGAAIADLLLLGAACAAPWIAEKLGLGGLDTSLRTTVLPGAAWLIAGATERRQPSPAPTVAALFLVLASAGFVTVHDSVVAEVLDEPGESLDWIRDHVDTRAVAIGVGPRSAVGAFYEQRGHRTGHIWYHPETGDELERLLADAVTSKAPMLVVMGEDDGVRPRLAGHYDALPIDGAPADVFVYAWRRR